MIKIQFSFSMLISWMIELKTDPSLTPLVDHHTLCILIELCKYDKIFLPHNQN